VKRWRIYPNAVWCEVHGSHHSRDTWLGEYASAGYFVAADECCQKDWRNLVIWSDEDEEF
jgi:hypothetical protein